MIIPQNAKKVFEGILFDTYQWQQEMFDGSFRTFEAIKRPDTVQIIPVYNGKIVLGDQQQPGQSKFISWFGGRVEKNEEPLQAAKRELLEESKLSSNDWELLQLYEPSSHMQFKVYCYIARNCKMVEYSHPDVGERIELKYYTFDEFMELISQKDFNGYDWGSEIIKMRFGPDKLQSFKDKLLL